MAAGASAEYQFRNVHSQLSTLRHGRAYSNALADVLECCCIVIKPQQLLISYSEGRVVRQYTDQHDVVQD